MTDRKPDAPTGRPLPQKMGWLLSAVSISLLLLIGYGLGHAVGMPQNEHVWIMAYLAVISIEWIFSPVPERPRFWGLLLLAVSIASLSLTYRAELFSAQSLLVAVAYGAISGIVWHVLLSRLLLKRLGSSVPANGGPSQSAGP